MEGKNTGKLILAITGIVLGILIIFDVGAYAGYRYFSEKKAQEIAASEESKEDVTEPAEVAEPEPEPVKEAEEVKEEPKTEEKEEEEPEEEEKSLEEKYADAYLKKAEEYKEAHSDTDSENITFKLIFFNDDEIPELSCGVNGGIVSLYTYLEDKDEVVATLDEWSYGVGGNAGYEYIPLRNVMRNYNSDYAGMIRYASFSYMGDDGLMKDNYYLKEIHFNDLDGNGEPGEAEEYSEEALQYFKKDEKVSKEDYDRSLIRGSYEYISGGEDFDDLKEELEKIKDGEKKEAPHSYEYVIADSTWDEAYNAAKEMGGRLASFDSEEEYNKVMESLLYEASSDISFYIGGKRDIGSEEYRWVNNDGEYFGDVINSSDYMRFWLSGEPSFKDGTIEEDRMNLVNKNNDEKWYFNDVPNDVAGTYPVLKGKIGFICEYEQEERD